MRSLWDLGGESSLLRGRRRLEDFDDAPPAETTAYEAPASEDQRVSVERRNVARSRAPNASTASTSTIATST